MVDYGIWLSFNNGAEGFQIPVNPERIEIADGGRGQTYDVVGLGEINVIKSPKLTEYGWAGTFPAQRYPWVVANPLHTPAHYVQLLEKWRVSLRPIRFVFAGATFGINTPTTIETLSWKEVAGSGDIEYTIKLKRYRFYGAQRVQVVPVTPGGTDGAAVAIQKQPPPRLDDRVVPPTYTLVSGDTLWAVAQRVLGDGSRWPEIQRLNSITDAEIKGLAVGRVLRIPGGEASGDRA